MDADVKVIFAVRGLDLTVKAGFEKGSSSGSETTDTYLPGPKILDPSEQDLQDLLLGKECMALIYA